MDKHEPIPFPAWRYHKDGRAVVVANKAADEALKQEGGWGDSPVSKAEPVAEAPATPVPPEPEAEAEPEPDHHDEPKKRARR